MGSAVANYLRNYLEEGSAVGIVKFSSDTTILADMTTIVDESTRSTLVSVVPTTVGGGTSIGAGMLRCGEVRNYMLCLCKKEKPTNNEDYIQKTQCQFYLAINPIPITFKIKLVMGVWR